VGKRQVIAAVILVVMEPLDDSQIERVLVVTAHPDDCDFAAAGTIALWTAKGIKVSYCICTNGDQGGEDPTVPRDEMPKIRQKEQRDAGVAVGVTDITFLNYRDGWLEPTIELRKDIVRQIRISKPDRMVIQSPERNWDRLFSSHPDHTFDKKMKALHSHVSQTAHNENLENMVREWGERNAQANNLPAGSVAEVFKIVNTN